MGLEALDRNFQRLPTLRVAGSDLPALVVGLEPPGAEVGLEFAPERNWFYVLHQTAGICCDHEWLYATRLAFRPEAELAAKELARTWLGSNAGCARADLDEVFRYRAQLRELFGLDCRFSYSRFQEAYYPIDPTHEAIRRLAVDDLPDDLDRLLVSETHHGRVYGSPRARQISQGGWQLVILGENSD